MQQLVRVWPVGYKTPFNHLNAYLQAGWKVVMVTVIISQDGNQVADYIIEKEDKNGNDSISIL